MRRRWPRSSRILGATGRQQAERVATCHPCYLPALTGFAFRFGGRRLALQNSRLLNHAREVRDRLFVDGRWLRLARLPGAEKIYRGRVCVRGRAAFDHENRKTPISKPAANAQRPNVQAETTRTRLWRSASCGISWDRSVIATPLRRPLARLRLIGAQKKAIDDDQADRNPSRPRSLARLSSWSRDHA